MIPSSSTTKAPSRTTIPYVIDNETHVLADVLKREELHLVCFDFVWS